MIAFRGNAGNMRTVEMEVGSKLSLTDLQKRLRIFAEERDWEQFHSPKNLAMAVCGEAGELAEIFQWLTEEESFLKGKTLEHAGEEMGDVLIYLVRLADRLGLDLLDCAYRKLERNARNYPVGMARGSARKHTEL